MGKLKLLFNKYTTFLWHFLQPLGPWGVLAIAIIDNASMAMPIDAVVAGYVWASHGRVILFAALAALGSAIGSLVPFYIGKAGGELFLLKHVDRARFERLRDRFESQEFLAIMIPSMLPPPTPFKLFVFSAGVFEMKTLLFMLAAFTGRFIRFCILGFLVLKYGPSVVMLVGNMMKEHVWLVLGAFVILIGLTVATLKTRAARRNARQNAAQVD